MRKKNEIIPFVIVILFCISLVLVSQNYTGLAIIEDNQIYFDWNETWNINGSWVRVSQGNTLVDTPTLNLLVENTVHVNLNNYNLTNGTIFIDLIVDETVIDSISIEEIIENIIETPEEVIELPEEVIEVLPEINESEEIIEVLADNPSIALSMINPTGNVNVIQNQFFNVSVEVTCNDQDCGQINVSLDPVGSPVSCKEVFQLDSTKSSGVHTIYPYNNGTSFNVYCDMDTDGGGWTLVGSVYQNTLDDLGLVYHSNLTTLTPTDSSATAQGIWLGMRNLSNTSRVHTNSTDDIRFSCKSDVDDANFAVDLIFYNIHWYYELTNSSSEASVCFEEGNGAGDTQPTPARRDVIGDSFLELNDQWAGGYLEGEDGCSSSTDFTVDFDDRGMDSNQNDGTDWGEDDGSKKCGSSTASTGAWFVWFREEANYSSSKSGLIPTIIGTSPFYTNVTNPYNVSLNVSESTIVTWYVNATGDLDDSFEFYIYANLTSNTSINTETAKWNTTIKNLPSIDYGDSTTTSGTYTTNSIFANITTTSAGVNLVTINLYDADGLDSTASDSSDDFSNTFSSLDGGTYYLNATINDIYGNKNNTATYTITIDSTNPLIEFDSPTPSNGTIQASNTVTISVDSTESNNNTVFLDWNQSLRLWYRMNNETGENSTLVLDQSTYGNNGTISGATISSAGKFGKGLSFDGINDQINSGNASSLNITDEITIEAWIKSGSEGYILAKDPTTNTTCLDLLNEGYNTNGAYNLTIQGVATSAYCKQQNDSGFGGGWTLFATTDSTRCAEGIPLGYNNLTDLTTVYATKKLGNMSNNQWLLELFDDDVFKFAVKMKYNTSKELDERLGDIVSAGESVNWTANYSGNFVSGFLDVYRFSHEASITSSTFYTRSTFSGDDGSWGVTSGTTLNAGSGGPALGTGGSTPKFGQENYNTGDAACNKYYYDTTSTTSSDIRMNIYIRDGDDSVSKENLPFALSTVDGGKFTIISDETNYNITSSINVNDNQWHHIAATYNGTEMRLYVDGTLTASGTDYNGTLPTNDDAVVVGRHYISSYTTEFFNGTMDEVRLHSRVLSPAEINSSYNANIYPFSNTFTNMTINATYLYTAYIQDIAGNLNQTEQRSVTYSTSANPIISVVSPENITYNETEVDLAVTADQNISSWLYSLDSGANISFTPNTTISSLSTENHILKVYAINDQNLIGTALANFSIAASEAAPAPSSGSGTSSGSGSSGGSSSSIETEEYECYTNEDCAEDETCHEHQCQKVFDIKIIEIEPVLDIDDTLSFDYFLKGMANINDDVIVRFWLEDENGEIITSGQDTIYLSEYEEKDEQANLYIPRGLDSGSYQFYIEVNYGDYIATSYRTVFVEDSGEEVEFSFDPITRETSSFPYFWIILILILGATIVFLLWNYKEKIDNYFEPKKSIQKKRTKQPLSAKERGRLITKGLLEKVLKKKPKDKIN